MGGQIITIRNKNMMPGEVRESKVEGHWFQAAELQNQVYVLRIMMVAVRRRQGTS